ncbi:MAG: hypothetical protein HMLIMOIP_002634 [Candidatus Nitrosomirales archaeon]|jgi:hypothetical protein
MQVKEQVIDFEAWMSPAARAERKMKSLATRLSAQEVTEFAKGDPLTLEEIEKLMSRRKVGKLDALIKIATIGFNKRFRQTGKYSYVMVG